MIKVLEKTCIWILIDKAQEGTSSHQITFKSYPNFYGTEEVVNTKHLKIRIAKSFVLMWTIGYGQGFSIIKTVSLGLSGLGFSFFYYTGRNMLKSQTCS